MLVSADIVEEVILAGRSAASTVKQSLTCVHSVPKWILSKVPWRFSAYTTGRTIQAVMMTSRTSLLRSRRAARCPEGTVLLSYGQPSQHR